MPIDRKLIHHALVNLLSNALKYSIDTNPILRLEFDNTSVLLKVIDKGIGIPAATCLIYFKRFNERVTLAQLKEQV